MPFMNSVLQPILILSVEDWFRMPVYYLLLEDHLHSFSSQIQSAEEDEVSLVRESDYLVS